MSFHSTVTAALVWPADLVTAGVAPAAAAVYTGRRRQNVTRQDREVWLERLPEQRGGGGFQHVTRYPYLVHVRMKSNAGGDKTGNAQLAAVEAHMQTIAARYHATVPFASSVSAMLPCEATEEAVDVDPEDEAVLDGTVRVTFSVKE